jgi:hypothetical protein
MPVDSLVTVDVFFLSHLSLSLSLSLISWPAYGYPKLLFLLAIVFLFCIAFVFVYPG